MSYRVRFTTQTGATFYWERTFATRTGATHSAQLRADSTGYTFAVEEVPDAPKKPTSTTERLVDLICDRHAKGLTKYGTTLDRSDLSPEDWAQHAIEEALDLAGYLMRFKDGFRPEPGSMAAHHVEILRARVKELEGLVDERGKAVTDAHAANFVTHWDLSFAIQLGDAMREAMRTGEWRAGHDRSMANSAMSGWDRWKASLAKAPSVPETPGEGGDSDRRRLEALDRWLKGENFRLVQASLRGTLLATDGMYEKDVAEAPTLLTLADKLAEKEAKP